MWASLRLKESHTKPKERGHGAWRVGARKKESHSPIGLFGFLWSNQILSPIKLGLVQSN